MTPKRIKSIRYLAAAFVIVVAAWWIWPNIAFEFHARRAAFVVVWFDSGQNGVDHWLLKDGQAEQLLQVLRTESIPERYPKQAKQTLIRVYLFDTHGHCRYACPIMCHRCRDKILEIAKTGTLMAQSDVERMCDFQFHHSTVNRVFRDE